jgi:hypothetical protein
VCVFVCLCAGMCVYVNQRFHRESASLQRVLRGSEPQSHVKALEFQREIPTGDGPGVFVCVRVCVCVCVCVCE